jgi:hypothetical protein
MAERRREQYGLADGGLRWRSVRRSSSVKVAREEIDGGIGMYNTYNKI